MTDEEYFTEPRTLKQICKQLNMDSDSQLIELRRVCSMYPLENSKNKYTVYETRRWDTPIFNLKTKDKKKTGIYIVENDKEYFIGIALDSFYEEYKRIMNDTENPLYKIQRQIIYNGYRNSTFKIVKTFPVKGDINDSFYYDNVKYTFRKVLFKYQTHDHRRNSQSNTFHVIKILAEDMDVLDDLDINYYSPFVAN